MQYFERSVFEYHPENTAPNDVLLSLLGNFAYKAAYPSGASGQVANMSPGSRSFAETGKRLGGVFLQYWNTHGSLAQQGYPISEEFIETSPLDGKQYRVQYFERSVFEYHPENPPPNDVLLSQLGTFRFQSRYASSAALPPPPVAVPPALAGGAPSGGPPAGNRPPSDVKQFANYIIQKYPRVGGHTLGIKSTFADKIGRLNAVDFDLSLGSVDYMIHQATAAEARSWGEAVFAEAKLAWPNEEFSVTLGWSGYTYDPCFDCADRCYYVSDDYTVGRGWYYSYTFVSAYHYDSGTEGVLNCID